MILKNILGVILCNCQKPHASQSVNLYIHFQHIARKDESIEANMVQYSCVDKYIDVIVADSAIPFWRSDVEFDCILADRNIKFIKMIND